MPIAVGRNGMITKGAAVVALCVVSGVIGAATTRQFGMSSYTISYADFITIMLTAVSVLMTTLAIFLAVLGVIGWNSIQSRVQDKTKTFLDDEFQEGRSLYVMMERKIDEYMYQGIMPAIPTQAEEEVKNTSVRRP